MIGVRARSVRSGFIEHWVGVAARELGLPGSRCAALDLAMGEGRHATLLAEAGFATFGVDVSVERLRAARERARLAGLTVHAWAADLDWWPFPSERFELLIVSRFLLRPRWHDLRALVKRAGFVIYETFTVEQSRRRAGPRSLDHLLHPGELARAFGDWDVLFAEEIAEPAALARLVARKPDA
ncbi:MAG: class I SAM-dependent methyltransferase [Acidobacteriota bacterium]